MSPLARTAQGFDLGTLWDEMFWISLKFELDAIESEALE
jgi:hypothetical protein